MAIVSDRFGLLEQAGAGVTKPSRNMREVAVLQTQAKRHNILPLRNIQKLLLEWQNATNRATKDRQERYGNPGDPTGKYITIQK